MQPHQTHRYAGLALTALLALAACSSSDDAATTTTEAPSPTSTAVTTVTTEPEAASTTESTTTTEATTTTVADTTTSVAPSTTAESSPAEEAVMAAAIESREAYLYAVYNVEAPDALDRLLASTTEGGASQEIGLENYQTIVDNGWVARPNPDVPDTITVESPVEFIDDTTAELTVCVVGAGVVLAPGAADDGSDIIVNDEIEAALNRITVVQVDGKWKLQTGTNLTLVKGEATCDEE